jgi:hypothetical protein
MAHNHQERRRSMNEQKIEQELRERGCNAPRLSPDMVDSVIVSEEYHVFNGKHMVCCLTLKNGYTVIGESAVVSPENFREDLGRRFSREKAREKVWAAESYLLQQRVHQESVNHIHGPSRTKEGY